MRAARSMTVASNLSAGSSSSRTPRRTASLAGEIAAPTRSPHARRGGGPRGGGGGGGGGVGGGVAVDGGGGRGAEGEAPDAPLPVFSANGGHCVGIIAG